jgi:hypothetical protein
LIVEVSILVSHKGKGTTFDINLGDAALIIRAIDGDEEELIIAGRFSLSAISLVDEDRSAEREFELVVNVEKLIGAV